MGKFQAAVAGRIHQSICRLNIHRYRGSGPQGEQIGKNGGKEKPVHVAPGHKSFLKAFYKPGIHPVVVFGGGVTNSIHEITMPSTMRFRCEKCMLMSSIGVQQTR